MNQEVFIRRIAELTAEASPDERALILKIAERVNAGRREYGELHVVKDRRVWRRELLEELLDAIVYGAISELAEEHERARDVRGAAPTIPPPETDDRAVPVEPRATQVTLPEGRGFE